LTLKLRSPAEALTLFGQNDENLKLLRARLRAKVVARGDEVRLSGDDLAVAEAERTFRSLLRTIRSGAEVSPVEIAFGAFDAPESEPETALAAGAGGTASRVPAGVEGGVPGTSGKGAVTPSLDAMTSAAEPATHEIDAAQPSVGSRPATAAAATTVVDEPPTDDARGPGPRLPGRARPKTGGQRSYVQAIADHPITFGIGPAGTGKTFLAVAMAVEALGAGRVKRIILTRPAVEAGERLGFLPGDLQAKIDPYLRPLYDALHDMLPADRVERLLEQGTIEVAPLAFMRGRTLNDAFIILDEAQNTTPEQMKMFLTRMGFNSKVVVTGDITQTDLPGSVTSGLMTAHKILQGIEGITFISFTKADVVRHPLVAQIVLAYEQHG
jgi:phosphate starvation-inducible protein PhoH